MSTYIHDISVSDDFLNNVKEALGYPVIDEEISDIYSDENIKKLVIANAFEYFFNFFPIVKTLVVSVSAGSPVTVEAPMNTLGIVHYALTNSASSDNQLNLNSGNPFYTERLVASSQSRLSNYGSPFNYNGSEYSTYQQDFYCNSAQAISRAFSVDYNEFDNTITVHSSQTGQMVIRVGTYSTSIDDIPNRLKIHLLLYCQGLLKVKFANILEMMNSDLPLEFDKEAIKDSGVDMLEKEEEWYQNNSTIQIMKR